jgi:hypothetical protein
VEIQDEYASEAIKYLHGSLFFGKEIKVAFSKHNKPKDDRDRGRRNSPPRRISPVRYSRPVIPAEPGKERFVIDTFEQLSHQRPPVNMANSRDIESLILRRKRLEVIFFIKKISDVRDKLNFEVR